MCYWTVRGLFSDFTVSECRQKDKFPLCPRCALRLETEVSTQYASSDADFAFGLYSCLFLVGSAVRAPRMTPATRGPGAQVKVTVQP